MENRKVTIGSRGSKLALAQAEFIKSEIRGKFDPIEINIKIIKTTGDKFLNKPLDKIGVKGLFTKEIEEALISNEIDIAVHSIKDLPTETPKGLKISAITKREDPRDALVSTGGFDLDSLPANSVVGTSSLRRRAQILNYRSDISVKDLRGNLDTRVKKLNDKLYDAIVVACAGIKRLGLDLKMHSISFSDMLPQAGQGALGIETRENDGYIDEIVNWLNDPVSCVSVEAERTVLSALGGGCHTPIGVYARVEGGSIFIDAGVFSLDGKIAVRSSISGEKKDHIKLAEEIAGRLLKKGAKEVLCSDQKYI